MKEAEGESNQEVGEALAGTDRCLRRLIRIAGESVEGFTEDESVQIEIKRSRRQLRHNRGLLGLSDPDGDTPAANT